MITRLAQCQYEDSEAGKSAGIKNGKAWAEEDAALHDLRRVCEEEDMDADTLLALLDGYWDADYIYTLGDDCDRPSFLKGYVDGFRDGATEAWNKVRDRFAE